MSYTVTLELPDGAMTLADCGDGDRPRQAPCAPDQPKATSYVAGIGFIGGLFLASFRRRMWNSG